MQVCGYDLCEYTGIDDSDAKPVSLPTIPKNEFYKNGLIFYENNSFFLFYLKREIIIVLANVKMNN